MRSKKIGHAQRTLRTLGAVAAMAIAMAPAAAAADTYTGTSAPNAGAVDTAVLNNGATAPGAGSTVGVQGVGTAKGVGAPAGSVAGAGAVAGGGEGSLPVTGADLASLALIGLGALGVGTALVLKTRDRTPEPA